MEDLKLKVRKRAFPSHGRSRVHSSVIDTLGLAEHDSIDVGIPGTDRWITVTAYGDSIVQPDTIRLSGEDITALGAGDGDEVIVRKTLPLTDQVRQAAKKTAGQVTDSLGSVKGKITGTVAPVTKRAGDAASAAYTRVSQELPTRDDLSQAIDSVKKRIAPGLTPDAAGTLLSLLYANKGAIRSITVPPGVEKLTIAGLDLPSGIAAIAIRRGKSTLIVPDVNTDLVTGDEVYFIGNDEALVAVLNDVEG